MSATLLSAWQRTVRAAPNAVALIDAGTVRVWTRRELDELSDAWFGAHGTAVACQTVLFSEPNGVGWLTVFIGLLKAGAVAAALDPGEPLVAQLAAVHASKAAFRWNAGRLEPAGARQRTPRDLRRVVKLTSGSTGVPRALAFTDAQMLADGRQVCAAMGIRPGDRNFALIPFGHSYGLGNIVIPLLAQGTAAVCGGAALPHAIAADVARWRPTVFPAVPALLHALAESEVERSQLKSLRTVISAGAPIAPATAARFEQKFGKKIHSFYGSSETGGITYDRTGSAAREGRSVGTPLSGVRLEFGLARRFAVASAAVFTLGNRGGVGRHRPADLGELNARGELVLLGRAGRMLKIAGRRLDPAEIERALRGLPGVSDALVEVHAGRSDALAAAVASREKAAVLRKMLQARIAGWKIPKRILVLPEFPLTARGKIDTRRLRALLNGQIK